MPDRLIRESWCSSETLDRLSPFEETVFVRMIVNCDDFGRMDGRIAVLCSRLFVTRRSVSESAVKSAVEHLAQEGLILCYEAEGKPYIQMQGWGKHQRIRNQRSKYPAPPDPEEAKKAVSHAYDKQEEQNRDQNNCPQLSSTVADCGLNPIQSESNPNPKMNPNMKMNLNPNLNPTREAETVATQQREEMFSLFWKEYPKKADKNGAREAFLQARGYLFLDTLLSALKRQKQGENWKKEGGRYIPKAANWLADGRWEETAYAGSESCHTDTAERKYTDEQILRLIGDPAAKYVKEAIG